MTLKKTLLTAALFGTFALCANAQNDLIVSQYIHNRFAINPAFAGSHEGLTLFGSFRKQWAGVSNTPTSILFTGHAPLKNEKLTVGLSAYNQSIHQSSNAGALLSLGFRTKLTRNSYLAFALQPGVSFRSTDWSKVTTMTDGDGAFAENESSAAPLLGFGVAWYGKNFFAGVSTTSLFVSDDFDQRDAKFDPANATYIATGGYWFDIDDQFSIQPSVMASYNQLYDPSVEVTVSGIYNRFAWLSLAYNINGEAMAGAAIQALPQLRVAYSYGFSTGDMNGYNSGTHEISIQYDLVYTVKTVGHIFF